MASVIETLAGQYVERFPEIAMSLRLAASRAKELGVPDNPPFPPLPPPMSERTRELIGKLETTMYIYNWMTSLPY